MDYTTIQNAATKIVDNLNAIDGSINALQNKQDIISTSDMSMMNSHDGKLKIEEIGGKCEQFTTTGVQLFDGNNAKYVENIAFDVSSNSYHFVYSGSDNHSRVYYVPVQPSTTYTISKELGSFFRVGTCKDIPSDGGVVTTVNDDTSKNVVTITTGQDDMYVAFYPLLVSEIATIGYDAVTEKVMLNTGSTSLPYEPYTGGIPAPNPDYPQEIKKVVISEVKSRGKNFIKLPVVNTTSHGVTVTSNNGTLTAKGVATENGGFNITLLNLKKGRYFTNTIVFRRDANATWLETIQANTVFEILDESQQIVPLLWFAQDTSYDYTVTPMICFEEYKDGEEPYTESIIKLSEPIELYGIGDVKDTIEDGKVVRRFNSVVIDGSEDENWYTENISSEKRRLVSTAYVSDFPAKSILVSDIANALSDKFKILSANATYMQKEGISVQNDIRICAKDFENAGEWVTHLQSSPMTLVYELATPVTEPLPAVDQIALNSLSTYDTVTYLDFDSEIEPIFKAEYGVTEIGGRVLEDLMTGLNSEILAQSDADRITALESTIVNNI